MVMAKAFWPIKDEYDIAIARWTETVWDPAIRKGILAYDEMGICRFGGANLYVCIYKVGDWMIRCFCSNPSHPTPIDIQERYIAISQFCRLHMSQVSALIPVTYVQHGITVGKRTLPIVKMPFLVDCPSLGEFIMDHYQDPIIMQRLSDAWLSMIRELEAVSMAHGDLDLSNILVQQHNTHITLKLIDYDNIWIPELAGRSQTEYGHTNFQHPNFLPPKQRPYNSEMDRFSALVIYISLKSLASHPELYEEWGADESDRLLLSESDYQRAGLVGSRITQLRNLSDAEMYPYFDELDVSLREKCMPRSLSDIATSAILVAQPPALFPVQSQKFIAISAPAISIWKDAVYKTNTFSPPLPSIASKNTEIPLSHSQDTSQNTDRGVNWAETSSTTLKPTKSLRGKRRITTVIIYLIVLIMLVASIALALLLTRGHRSGTVASPSQLFASSAHRLASSEVSMFGASIPSTFSLQNRATPTPSPTLPPTPTATALPPTPSPTLSPTATALPPTPSPTPISRPSPSPTPSSTSKPTPAATLLPTSSPTTPRHSTPTPSSTLPSKSATPSPTLSPTSISSTTHTSNIPPSNGGNSTQESPFERFPFIVIALVLAILAFLLYLMPQEQSSLRQRINSLIWPISLLQRSNTRKEL